MCLIIYTPNGRIPKKHLKRALTKNPDGWGLMWPSGNGRLIIHRGMERADFWKTWKTRPLETPLVFHARWGSHGLLNESNCHPFRLDRKHGQLAVCHNGIILRCEPPKDSDSSDTKIFVESILNKLPRGFLKENPYVNLITSFIGTSKLVFMDGRGRATIINSHYGEWRDDRWYSNGGYKPLVARKSKPTDDADESLEVEVEPCDADDDDTMLHDGRLPIWYQALTQRQH